ncbi:MAG: chemotaxis protein CheX [Phycisphaerae bacterium]
MSTDPLPHLDCVRSATEGVFSSTCGLQLSAIECDPQRNQGPVMMAVISLVGDLEWSVLLAVPQDTATAVVTKFCGFDIPFESADMSDAIGELTNIFAGQVKACLDQKGVAVEISLPSVLRADNLQVIAPSDGVNISLCYQTDAGPLWTGVLAARQ